MSVRFKKTDKGEIAILPRKEYEALAAKSNHRRAAISKHHTADSSLPLVYRDRAGGYQTV